MLVTRLGGVTDVAAADDRCRIGRLYHAVEDDPAGRIAVPGVVLHIETSLGQVGQREADDERLAPVAQEAETGEARQFVNR